MIVVFSDAKIQFLWYLLVFFNIIYYFCAKKKNSSCYTNKNVGQNKITKSIL